MPPISVAAHFDGERILLDEPMELAPNTRLLVTILPTNDAERDSWLALSAQRLSDAYGDNEPDYALDSITEANPEHEGK